MWKYICYVCYGILKQLCLSFYGKEILTMHSPVLELWRSFYCPATLHQFIFNLLPTFSWVTLCHQKYSLHFMNEVNAMSPQFFFSLWTTPLEVWWLLVIQIMLIAKSWTAFCSKFHLFIFISGIFLPYIHYQILKRLTTYENNTIFCV